MLKLQVRDQSDPLTYSKMKKTIRQEKALIPAKAQMSERTKGHKQGPAASITRASIIVEADVEAEVSPTIEALTQAIIRMVQSQTTLQQTFSEVQKTVGK